MSIDSELTIMQIGHYIRYGDLINSEKYVKKHVMIFKQKLI